jgi:hypothetical protein
MELRPKEELAIAQQTQHERVAVEITVSALFAGRLWCLQRTRFSIAFGVWT